MTPLVTDLVTDLRVFLNKRSVKAGAHLDTAATVPTTREATEAQRAALQELDLRCQLAGGGPKNAGYLASHNRNQGLG